MNKQIRLTIGVVVLVLLGVLVVIKYAVPSGIAGELPPTVSRSPSDKQEPLVSTPIQQAQPETSKPENPDRMEGGWPVLVEAAYRNDQAEVERLLALGANINHRGVEGWTALMQAAGNNHMALTVFLLDHGAVINLENSAMKNAYDLAAERGYESIALLLLERGAADNELRLFINHIFYGRQQLVEQMLEDGFDINRTDYKGRSPLFYTLSNRHAERYVDFSFKLRPGMIHFLLDHGADPNIRDHEGVTPLLAHVTEYGGVQEIIALLMQYNSDLSASKQGRTILFTLLDPANFKRALALGADVNQADAQGDTPLHHWCRAMHPSMVQLLLDNGADTTALNQSGKTPTELFPETNPGGRQSENWLLTKAILDKLASP